jgi:hypothetical protein
MFDARMLNEAHETKSVHTVKGKAVPQHSYGGAGGEEV